MRVNFLFLTSSALITVKRAELKRKIKGDKAAAAAGGAAGSTETISGSSDKKEK
eukprot:gene23876-30153_t